MINFLVQIYNVNIYICYRCIFYLKFLYHKYLSILKYSFLYVFVNEFLDSFSNWSFHNIIFLCSFNIVLLRVVCNLFLGLLLDAKHDELFLVFQFSFRILL